eukprot:CAMPEP_0183727924 /NCGR_PEP_ID=MMETSP0737-20130205/26753_1 /TAXON_ID=385413 /ORGANISM="Thalassiosira miniscula, Strain CCMP1093" /LENGTH=372 /DNA_ID=CAMNT_0025959691 /DNA_START=159 /DNA_END=1274 /DNA_ORIENTATION=+
MDISEEPGRTARTPGHYDPGMFGCVQGVDDFAYTLQVPKKSIALVVPSNDRCKSKECPFNAILGNRGFCPAHCRSWYPLVGTRGEDLCGPDFLRYVNDKLRDCDCDQASCKKAGYFPRQAALYIPADGMDVVLGTPNLLSNEKKNRIKEKKGVTVFLYAWHFFREHRELDQDGKWKLNYKRGEKYYDMEGNAYSFPPPRNAPLKFVEDEYFYHHTHPRDRWATENARSKMPSWMLNMLVIDSELAIDQHSKASNESSPKRQSLSRVRIENEMWRARAYHLQKMNKMQADKHREEIAAVEQRHQKRADDIIKQHIEENNNLLSREREIHQQMISIEKDKNEVLLANAKRKYEEISSAKEATILNQQEELSTLW